LADAAPHFTLRLAPSAEQLGDILRTSPSVFGEVAAPRIGGAW
jgi:hypothetical protein